MQGLIVLLLILIWYGYPFLDKKEKSGKDIFIKQTGLLFFSPGVGMNGIYQRYCQLKTEKAKNTYFFRLLFALAYLFFMIFILIKFIILPNNGYQTEKLFLSALVIIFSGLMINKFMNNVKD